MKTVIAVLIGLAATVASVLLLAWLLWRLWTDEGERAPTAIEIEVPEIEEVEAPVKVEEEAPQVPAATEAPAPPGEADDLKVIEGIGPKISRVLAEAGITTFAQLAATDPEEIRNILEASDPRLGRLADPSTWPDQAALAAGGNWEALTSLKGELRRGRRA